MTANIAMSTVGITFPISLDMVMARDDRAIALMLVTAIGGAGSTVHTAALVNLLFTEVEAELNPTLNRKGD